MSREQWGHGFHTGYKAALQAESVPTYIVTLAKDGFPIHLYIVRKYHGNNIYTVERYDDPIHYIALLGTVIPFDERDINKEYYEEINIYEIGKYKIFYDKDAMLAFLTTSFVKYKENRSELL